LYPVSARTPGVPQHFAEHAGRVEQAPLDGPNGTSLGPTELADAALITTYVPSAVPPFYAALSQGLNGRAGPMLQLTEVYRTSVDFPAYTAVECTDSPHPVGTEAYQAFARELIGASSRFGGTVANELLPCAYWGSPVESIVGPVTATDAPPILVVGTTGDAATPYQQAVDVAHTLAHGRLITYQGNQHAAYGASQCVADAEAAYFVDLQLPPEGTVCNN